MIKKILLFCFIMIINSPLIANECRVIHSKSEHSDVLKKNQIVWFATWCKPCLHKIEKLTKEEFLNSWFVGVFDDLNNIENAYKFFAQSKGIEQTTLQKCLFDSNGSIAKEFNIKHLPQ